MAQQLEPTKSFSFTEEPTTIEQTQGKKRAFTHSSSWVGNVRYNPQNQTMRVMMNNQGYGFCSVPERVFDAWEGSSSKGEYWWRNIKDQYNCSSLGETVNNNSDDLEPLDSEYSYKEMREALLKQDIINKVIKEVYGQQTPQKIKEFFENDDEDWPPKITGLQIPEHNSMVPFDNGLPADGKPNIHYDGINDPTDIHIPLFTTDIQGHASESNIEQLPVEKVNWYGLAARTDAEPPQVNLEGWNGYKDLNKVDLPFEDQSLAGLNRPVIYDDLTPKVIGMDSLRETIYSLRDEFKWLTPDYLNKLKEYEGAGKWLLIRAGAEAITDHRREGEQYPRYLSAQELNKMTRTAVGHGADLNHLGPRFKTEAYVVDAEFDEDMKQMQMLVYEQDPNILKAVNNGTLGAVSINGSAPRSKTIEPCAAGTCEVPRGVILGQDDDIAFTYVVTNPQGFYYKGTVLPPAEPGVKVTKIEML